MEPILDAAEKRSVDVTGLPEESIEVVEAVVAALRDQANSSSPQWLSYEEWSKAFRGWVCGHEPRGTSADWSRENIYTTRGE